MKYSTPGSVHRSVIQSCNEYLTLGSVSAPVLYYYSILVWVSGPIPHTGIRIDTNMYYKYQSLYPHPVKELVLVPIPVLVSQSDSYWVKVGTFNVRI